MMVSKSSSIFQGLDKTFQDLMFLTPQQLADVSRRAQAGDRSAPPPFLIVAAIDAQNKAQQRQTQPPTQTVAEDVVAQAASRTAPQPLVGSGVAALPAEVNYAGGGLVSFADGGDVSESAIQAIHKKYPFMSEEDIRKGLETVFRPTESMLGRGYTAPSDDLTAVAPSEVPNLLLEPEQEPTYADYFKKIVGPSGAGISGLPSAEDMIAQYKGAVAEMPSIEGPATIEAQIAADREGRKAAGIDPEAELQRQLGLADKRRKEAEEYKTQGKYDVLLQLGAALMAGKSPNALVNIGEAFQKMTPALNEYRAAVEKRNELADQAEELSRQAAYKQKVGDYEGSKKTLEDRELKNKEIELHNVDAGNKAATAALTEMGANRRAAIQEAGANTRHAQAAALDLMKLDQAARLASDELAQKFNLEVLKTLDLDSISDKDLAEVYKNVQESSGFSEFTANFRATHARATPEQISNAQNKFVRDRINDYMRMRNETMSNQSLLNSYRQKAALGESGITSLSPR